MPSFGNTYRNEHPQEAAGSIPATEPVAPAPAIVVQQAQKKSSGLLILVITLAFLAIGGVGFGVFGMIQANKKQNVVTADAKETNRPTADAQDAGTQDDDTQDTDTQDANTSFSRDIVGKWGCVSPLLPTMEQEELDKLLSKDYQAEITIGEDGSMKLVNIVSKSTITGRVIGGTDYINEGKKDGYSFATILKDDNNQAAESWVFRSDALEDSELKSKQQVVSFALSPTARLSCIKED